MKTYNPFVSSVAFSLYLTFVSLSLTFVSLSLTFVSLSLTFVSLSLPFVSLSLPFVSLSLTFVSLSNLCLFLSLKPLLLGDCTFSLAFFSYLQGVGGWGGEYICILVNKHNLNNAH
jgi:energy-coupling factor transporter transmembrane protein EcfT